MANTFTLIASSTVGAGGAASIDFTSIASTWTDLVIKISARNTSTGDQIILKANGSSTGLAGLLLYGGGSGSGSSTTIAGYGSVNNTSGQTASTFGSGEIYIPNYAGSSNKSASSDSVQETNAAGAYAVLTAWAWSNTAAITSLSLVPNTGTFAQYSTAYLYGVKNA